METYDPIFCPVALRAITVSRGPSSCDIADDLFDAHHRDVQPGQGGAEPDVGLVLHQHDLTALGHQEVGAGDAAVRLEEARAQGLARYIGERDRILGGRRAQLLGEERANGLAVEVQRGGGDVTRTLSGDLNDELARGPSRGPRVRERSRYSLSSSSSLSIDLPLTTRCA